MFCLIYLRLERKLVGGLVNERERMIEDKDRDVGWG